MNNETVTYSPMKKDAKVLLEWCRLGFKLADEARAEGFPTRAEYYEKTMAANLTLGTNAGHRDFLIASDLGERIKGLLEIKGV